MEVTSQGEQIAIRTLKNISPAISIVRNEDSGYTVLGNESVPSIGNCGPVLLKFNSTGDLESKKYYGDAETDSPRCIAKTPENGWIIGGSRQKNVWIICIDSDGSVLWERVFGSESNDLIKDVAVDFTGKILATGYSRLPSKPACSWILTLDPNGNPNPSLVWKSNEVDGATSSDSS